MAKFTTIDPVEGLVQYVQDIKPYHTKIIEVLVEYTAIDQLNVQIVDQSNIDVHIANPATNPIPFGCNDGFSTLPYGGPGLWPIISPNLNIAFEDYPAIDPSTNSFTIPGERARDFPANSTIELVTFVEDYQHIYKIVSSQSIANSAPVYGQFVVEDPLNDFAVNHPPFPTVTTPIQTVGAYKDDGRSFIVRNVLPNTPSAGLTTVQVGQSILSPTAGGYLGMKRTPGNNSGTYTIVNAINNKGFVDSWPGYPNPDYPNYLLGNDPHTIITVNQPLVVPDFAPATQVYVAFVRMPGLVVEKVLSYSNFIAYYDSSPIDFSQTPDEGLLTAEITQAQKSSVTTSGSPIGVVIPDSGRFTVPYNLEVSNIFVGGSLQVRNSPSNDGTYTITSISYDPISGTTFGVAEEAASNTAGGVIDIDIPSNVFIVDGNHTGRFFQGKKFEIVGGTFRGTYTTLYSDYVDGKTRIRVTRDIVDHYDITSNSSSTDLGILKDYLMGFGESGDICELTPEGLVRIKFDEKLRFEGLGVELTDTVIAYNLENTDREPYYLPINAVVSNTAPNTGSPSLTANPPQTYWWFDTTTNALYYRIVSSFVDTGWMIYNNDTDIQGYNTQPHKVYHSSITANTTIGGYVIPGGNYVDRFTPDLEFELWEFGAFATPYAPVIQTPTTFPIIDVDGSNNTITIDGDWTELFGNAIGSPGLGRVFTVLLSGTNNQSFSVVSSTAVGLPAQTVITVEQPVSETFFTNPSLDTIEQNYTRDLGVILGAVYDPVVDGLPVGTDQVKTYVIPSTPVETSVEGMTYTWLGPLRMQMAIDFQNNAAATFVDGLGITNELLEQPDRYLIINTNASANTFTVTREDPTLIIPVDLTGIFRSGSSFVVQGSELGTNASPTITNNKTYTVANSIFNGTNTIIEVVENIEYDSTIVAPNIWINGYIIREAFNLGAESEGVAATFITDTLDFGWGSTFRWEIIDDDAANSTITIKGDITSILFAELGSPTGPNDQLTIIGSANSANSEINNNGIYDVVSYTYNPVSNVTNIVVSPDLKTTTTPPNPYGTAIVNNIDVTDWFQYLIKETKPNIIEVWGNVFGVLQAGQQFRVYSPLNNGVYTVSGSVTYNSTTGISEIPVIEATVNEFGGFIESFRDYGIRLIFRDTLASQITEHAEGAVLDTAGSMSAAWDYGFWNLGVWDEVLGQTIILNSSGP